MYNGKIQRIYNVTEKIKNDCAEIAETSGAWGSDVFRKIKTDINIRHEILIDYRLINGELTGFIKGNIEGYHHLYSIPQLMNMSVARIDWLFVDEQYQKKGIGTQLVQAFIQEVQKSDVGGVYACISDIKKTRNFYTQQGFKPLKFKETLYYKILKEKVK